MNEFFSSTAGSIIVALLYVGVILAIFTVPIGMFNTRMYRGSTDEKPTGMDLLKAYIPIFNVRYSRVLCYGGSPIYMAGCCVAIFFILLRFIAVAAVAADIGFMVYVYMFSSLFPLVAVLLWWVLVAINGVSFGNMLGAGLPTKLLCCILPPLGYYLLAQNVLPYFKESEE